jgi:hypothetical protein
MVEIIAHDYPRRRLSRYSRASEYLPDVPTAECLKALDFITLHSEFLRPRFRSVTISWPLTSLYNGHNDYALTKSTLAKIRDWCRRRSIPCILFAARENSAKLGPHLHLALHIASGSEGDFDRYLRQIVPKRASGAIKIKTTLGRYGFCQCGEREDFAHFIGRYMLKGASPQTRSRLGLDQCGFKTDQGVLKGKRLFLPRKSELERWLQEAAN